MYSWVFLLKFKFKANKRSIPFILAEILFALNMEFLKSIELLVDKLILIGCLIQKSEPIIKLSSTSFIEEVSLNTSFYIHPL